VAAKRVATTIVAARDLAGKSRFPTSSETIPEQSKKWPSIPTYGILPLFNFGEAA